MKFSVGQVGFSFVGGVFGINGKVGETEVSLSINPNLDDNVSALWLKVGDKEFSLTIDIGGGKTDGS